MRLHFRVNFKSLYCLNVKELCEVCSMEDRCKANGRCRFNKAYQSFIEEPMYDAVGAHTPREEIQ